MAKRKAAKRAAAAAPPAVQSEAPEAVLRLAIQSGAVQTEKPEELRFVIDYLMTFGHLLKGDWRDITLGDIANAVLSFQSFFGLEQDGVAGPKTIRAMLQTPRCGCPDVVQERHQEYLRMQDVVAEKLQQWGKRELTYRIISFVSGLAQPTQREVIRQAWNSWESVCGIRVKEVDTKGADIIIATGSSRQEQFDGPGGTLAWAYLPNGRDTQLQMKFDLSETWTVDSRQRGTLMLNVAAHEFGHLLGLDHSRVNGALMAPYYNAVVAKPQANDDIPRVVARYGEPAAVPSVPTTPTSPAAGELLIKVRGTVTGIEIPGYSVQRL
jgi:hypothetical protein